MYLQREDAKNQKGFEKEKQGGEGEENELQKCFDLEVIKTIYTCLY